MNLLLQKKKFNEISFVALDTFPFYCLVINQCSKNAYKMIANAHIK